MGKISVYKSLRKHDIIKSTEKRFKDIHWRKLFYVDKWETANRKFNYEITTDGRAVSILMIKPQKNINKIDIRNIKLDDYDNIWGLDPCRRDLFVASDKDNNIIKCSSKEYYNDAKFDWCNKKIRYWYDIIIQIFSMKLRA